MKKGEICIVEMPNSNGHEQIGTRPAIIVADTKTSITVVIPCTTNMLALRFPHTLFLEANAKNDLDNDSVALILQIRAIDRYRIKKTAGVLDKTDLQKMNKMLKALLSL